MSNASAITNPGWTPQSNLTRQLYDDLLFVHSVTHDGIVIFKPDWPQRTDCELFDWIQDNFTSLHDQNILAEMEQVLRCMLIHKNLHQQVAIHPDLLLAMRHDYNVRDQLDPIILNHSPIPRINRAVNRIALMQISASSVLSNYHKLAHN